MKKENARLTEAKPSAQAHAHLTSNPDPTVCATARLVRDGLRSTSKCVWILKLTCPHCGKTHTHGGGDGPVPFGGHRVAHCVEGSGGGYFITLDTDKSEGSPYDDLC